MVVPVGAERDDVGVADSEHRYIIEAAERRRLGVAGALSAPELPTTVGPQRCTAARPSMAQTKRAPTSTKRAVGPRSPSPSPTPSRGGALALIR
ncbi:MAG: hypothetical protein FJ137_00955 [Deltaproteobacteria bacterium]|nr:hypothetical protein [Deltaproteobacteria bacterium]